MCSKAVQPAQLARTGLTSTELTSTGSASMGSASTGSASTGSASTVFTSTGSARNGADIAARLATAIDELAAAASGDQDAAAGELAERLALAWAMIVSADPELAARAARYSRS
jgi:hypothetical protein